MSAPVRLTRQQAAIIGAYTGYTCGPFGDVHGYVGSLPGFRGITTIGFAMPGVAERIREAAKADFLALCFVEADDPDATQVLPPPVLTDDLDATGPALGDQ